MAVKAHLERMFRSMSWADRQALAALRDCSAAQAEALPLLAHLLAAEHVWLARLEQRAVQLAVWPPLALDECQQLAAKNEIGYMNFVERIDESQLAAKVAYCNTRGRNS